jgi:two-component system NtrC family response regulator
MRTPRILIVEDDLNLQRVLEAQVERMGYDVSTAGDASHAREALEKDPYDLVITDLNLPGISGLELLEAIRADYPGTMVILITAYGTVQTAVQAMKAGAYDYLTKPLHPFELKTLINRALERAELIEEVQSLRSSVDRKYGFENIVGSSEPLLRVLEAAGHVAATDATVLIQGESGTGKELLAKAIHFNSPRRDRPFVVINCGAIPKELLESELFGYIRGAFTGAMTHKKGKVEAADGGTLLLDEIGEMPLELQVRILRLVQEHEIEKIGGSQPIKVNVRIIAATHRDLEQLVARGEFREDLYYRLSVIPLTLPPLRERASDIPELVEQFFDRIKQIHKKEHLSLPASLIPYFQQHKWPGNVRELENTISRIVLMTKGDRVTLSDLEEWAPSIGSPQLTQPELPSEDDAGLMAIERVAIISALRKSGGNQSKAARYLKITRKVLINRIAKYDIHKDEFQVFTASPQPARAGM